MAITITLTDEHAEQYLEHAVEFQKYLANVKFGPLGVRAAPVIAKADLPETGAPLPNAPVPSTAAVAASSTAQMVGTASSLDPQIAFAPAAPSPAPTVPTAAVPAPPAPPAPPVIVPTPVTLDKNGFPWDTRIHSSSKGLNADGTWRAKRGVDAELVKTVEAELKQLMGIQLPLPTAAAPADVPPPPPVAAPTDVDVAVPPSTTVPLPPADAAPSNVMTFAGLVGAVMPRITSGILTQDQVNKVLNEFGIPAIPLLASRPDLIPAVALSLGIV